MNIRWERIIPRQRRPPPTKAREAARSAVKRCPLRPNWLLKDSLAVVSRLLSNCGWISCNSEEWEEVCPCASVCVCVCVHSPFLCICMAGSKREGWLREVFISIYLHKPPIGFYSSCLFIMNCDGLYSKAVAVRGGFQGLNFFGYVWEWQGEEKSCASQIFVYICMHGFGKYSPRMWRAVCMGTHAAVHMRMNNWIWNYSAYIYHRDSLVHLPPVRPFL